MKKIDFETVKKYENIDLLSKQLVEGFITGLHRSPYHGFSVEFSEHRLYNIGDSIRDIDWKLYARTDKLFSKRYEEETNLRAHILIDTSSSMYYPQPDHDKIKFSILLAACLSRLLHKQKDAVGLYSFDKTLQQHTNVKSSSTHLKTILKCLHNLYQPNKNHVSNIPLILHQIAQKAHKRSLIILFTDFLIRNEELPELFTSFQNIKHNNHELIMFHLQDKATEHDFKFDAIPHKFVDLETGNHVKLDTLQIKDTYKQNLDEFIKKIVVKAGQYKLDYNLVNTAMSFEEIFSTFLSKRNRM